MIIKKKLSRCLIYLVSFLIVLNISYALPYIYMRDDWFADYGTDTDEAIFVDYEIFPETLGIIDMDADMVCYDWTDDETYDNCYWDSNGCGGSCNANSCDYYAIPYNMPDGQKAGCDIDYGLNGCTIGSDVPSRICGTCNGVDTSTEQRTYIDTVVYYDCDNSNNNRHVDSLDNDDFFVVKPKKYDCDDGASSDFDYEGDFSPSGASWADIKLNIGCGDSSLDCDENHDDGLVYTAYGYIDDPCRTKNGYACGVNGDCISDYCAGNYQDRYRSHCMASNYYQKQYEDHYKCCTTGCEEPWANYWGEAYCSSGYECDYAGDDEEFTDPMDMPALCKRSDGGYCSADSDCLTGHQCVHLTCRPTDPYCGDTYCDAGETYSNCPSDCCESDCTESGSIYCRSACHGYSGCSFYNAATKYACNGQNFVTSLCLDSDTKVDCCEGAATDCASDEYCSYGNCEWCTTLCDGTCYSSECYGIDPDCDSGGNPTQICCGNDDCESGETYSNCVDDCCDLNDCTATYDSTCHAECEWEETCSLTAGCNGNPKGLFCLDSDTYVNCCEGTPADCSGNNYCSGGSCLTCNTECNDNCQSSACYGDDPDCDSNGNVNGKCGDGVCCQETSFTCPQDCEVINNCNGTIQVIVQDSKGNGINGSYIHIDEANNNGTTNSVGIKDFAFINTPCGLRHNISVYCKDNARLCGIKDDAVDFDGDYDSFEFDCNLCVAEGDLFISQSDVSINQIDTSNSNITAQVHAENIGASNLEVLFQGIGVDGLVDLNETKIISSLSNASQNVSVSWNLYPDTIQYIRVYVDPNKNINESKENNYVLKPVLPKLKVYVEVNTGFANIDNIIKEYIKLFGDYVPENQAQAKIIVSNINLNPNVESYNKCTKDHGPLLNGREKWSVENNAVSVEGKEEMQLDKPYSGVIGTCLNNSKYTILIYGNDMDGTIAAVKKFASAASMYFNTVTSLDKPLIILDQYDLTGISVYDLLHNEENGPYYTNKSSPNFENAVRNVLYDNNFDVAIKTVKTINDNTTLRMKHSNSAFSSLYKDAVLTSQQPVVLAHGIHSNLYTWDDFGRQLATSGRDTWLIEPYGGPTTECDGCPDYTFDDLTTYYWPALVAGVQHYSGQNELSYVGYDLGCTVALESLEKYEGGKNNASYYLNDQGQWVLTDLSSNPVETFVGAGCIGNFTYGYDDSETGKVIIPLYQAFISSNKYIYSDNSSLTNQWYHKHIPSYYHISPIYFLDNLKAGADYFSQKAIEKAVTTVIPKAYGIALSGVIFVQGLFDASLPSLSGEKVSVNIFNELNDWMYRIDNNTIGNDVNVTNVAIIQSTYVNNDCSKGLISGDLNCRELKYSDGFIMGEDQRAICKNVNSNNKYYVGFHNLPHFSPFVSELFPSKAGIDKNPQVKYIIYNFLNNHAIEPNPTSYEVISNNQECG